nr:DUF5360 family protein [Flexivirga meconopsidis]
MFVTDVGFLCYWLLTAGGAISVGVDPFLHQWNWSFIGLDLLAIALGLLSVATARRSPERSRMLMVISLTATAAAGLMAINFYAIRCSFDPAWWLPNLWLLLFPVIALGRMFTKLDAPQSPHAVAR